MTGQTSGLVGLAEAGITAALGTVPGLRVFTDPAAVSAPPAAYVGPPVLTWDALCAPTDAEFTVYLVVAASDRAQTQLLDLCPAVATAIDDQVPDTVVTSARPGVFTVGGADLPAYELSVTTAL